MNRAILTGIFRTEQGDDLPLHLLRVQMFPLDLSEIYESRGVGLFEDNGDQTVRLINLYRERYTPSDGVRYRISSPLSSTFDEAVRDLHREERHLMAE